MSPEAAEELQRMMAGGSSEGQIGKFGREARGITGRMGGAVQSEASLERGRIGRGEGFAPLMASMQKATMASVDALGNFKGALTALSDTVKDLMKIIGSLTKRWSEDAISEK